MELYPTLNQFSIFSKMKIAEISFVTTDSAATTTHLTIITLFKMITFASQQYNCVMYYFFFLQE